MTKASLFIGLFVGVFGAFYAIGALTDWDRFMRARQARTVVAALGRKGARYFYSILGALMCVIGALLAMYGFPGTNL